MTITFALNHRVAPKRDIRTFFDIAGTLGVRAVEIRNDLPGTAMSDGTPGAAVRREADARDLHIISINALQRFNHWTAQRAAEATDLIAYSQACGAEALVLCPVNDAAFAPARDERLDGLRMALRSLAPMLRNAGLKGLVEPLGFSECSLRSKREAVEAIDAVEAADVLFLVHDTFHHHVAGEPELFPERTGLVHISGVSDPAVATRAMRDPHRVLVGPDDRIDNLGQIEALVSGHYTGVFSFEPFADSISDLPDARASLEDSMAFIADALVKRS